MTKEFETVVTSEADLRELYRLPAETTVKKKLTTLDVHARAFIESSPFMLIGTASPDGTGIGLIFLIPGVDETLRVNGRACLTTDPAVLDRCAVKDRRPKAAIGVTVTQQYMHCAKAFRRSDLWNPQAWPDLATLPSAGCIARDQYAAIFDVPAADIEVMLEANYATTMWEPGGKP